MNGYTVDHYTQYQRFGNEWTKYTSVRTSSGAQGHSVTLCKVKPDLLIQQGTMIACQPVDWFYRTIMWLYPHVKLRRLIIWYRTLED